MDPTTGFPVLPHWLVQPYIRPLPAEPEASKPPAQGEKSGVEVVGSSSSSLLIDLVDIVLTDRPTRVCCRGCSLPRRKEGDLGGTASYPALRRDGERKRVEESEIDGGSELSFTDAC